MISKERVVPVKAADLLSIYATQLKLVFRYKTGSTTFIVLDPVDTEGHFVVPDDVESAIYFASQPAKKISFAGETNPVEIYFVPDYGFEGFGADVDETNSDAIDAESADLYIAGRNVDHGEAEDVVVKRITPAAN